MRPPGRKDVIATKALRDEGTKTLKHEGIEGPGRKDIIATKTLRREDIKATKAQDIIATKALRDEGTKALRDQGAKISLPRRPLRDEILRPPRHEGIKATKAQSY